MALRGLAIKTLIFSFLVYRWGFFYAVLITIVRGYAISWILKLLFGYDAITGFANLFCLVPKENKFIMTGFLLLEDYKPEEWRNMIIERGIRKFRELRRVVVSVLGNFYWKEEDYDLAEKCVKIKDDVTFKTIEEISYYSVKEQSITFSEGKIPWEFHLTRFGDKGGVIFVKFDHCLCDGVGFLIFLMALADNYSLSLFPQMKETPWYMKLLFKFTNPYYAIKTIIRNASMKVKPSPFKRSVIVPGKKKLYVSSILNFSEVSRICKKMKTTFNELITALISINYKKIVTEYDEVNGTKSEKKYATIVSPASLRPLPKTLDEFVIENNIASQTFEIPLIDNLDDISGLKKILTQYLKDPFYNSGNQLQQEIIGGLIPGIFVDQSIKMTCQPVDLIISNVPGPKEALFYCGSKVTSLMATPQQGFFNNSIVIISYNNGFRFATVKADLESLTKRVEADLQRLISN